MHISKKLYFHKWNIKIFVFHRQVFIFHCQGTELQIKHYTTKCKRFTLLFFNKFCINVVYKKENSNFWSEYDFYFIDRSEKMYTCISFLALPLMKYTFFHFIRWNRSYIHSKNWNILYVFGEFCQKSMITTSWNGTCIAPHYFTTSFLGFLDTFLKNISTEK